MVGKPQGPSGACGPHAALSVVGEARLQIGGRPSVPPVIRLAVQHAGVIQRRNKLERH